MTRSIQWVKISMVLVGLGNLVMVWVIGGTVWQQFVGRDFFGLQLRVVSGVVVFTLGGIVAWGMQRGRKWALWASCAMAALLLVIGCGWMVMIYGWALLEVYEKEGASLYRLIQTFVKAWPLFLPPLIGPLLWLGYFIRPSVRARFRRKG